MRVMCNRLSYHGIPEQITYGITNSFTYNAYDTLVKFTYGSTCRLDFSISILLYSDCCSSQHFYGTNI